MHANAEQPSAHEGTETEAGVMYDWLSGRRKLPSQNLAVRCRQSREVERRGVLVDFPHNGGDHENFDKWRSLIGNLGEPLPKLRKAEKQQLRGLLRTDNARDLEDSWKLRLS